MEGPTVGWSYGWPDGSANMFVLVVIVIVIVMLYYSDQPEFDGKGGNEKMLAEKKWTLVENEQKPAENEQMLVKNDYRQKQIII